MKAHELARKLLEYPNADVVISHDWSEPLLDDRYVGLDTGPVIALCASEHGNHPDEVARLRRREAARALIGLAGHAPEGTAVAAVREMREEQRAMQAAGASDADIIAWLEAESGIKVTA